MGEMAWKEGLRMEGLIDGRLEGCKEMGWQETRAWVLGAAAGCSAQLRSVPARTEGWMAPTDISQR